MPEYRKDPITGRIVIIAPNRAERPHLNFGDADALCPFCEGNETETTSEIAAFRSENSPSNSSGWKVRCVSNKFPAVCEEQNETAVADGFYSEAALGHHEVIIDTPRHITSIGEMHASEVILMFKMYQERIRTLRQEKKWTFVQVFKNVGAAAGASIPHSHSQLAALPFSASGEQRIFPPMQDTAAPCSSSAYLAAELEKKIRIISETEHAVALCPFASRFAGEVEVYPKHCVPALDFLNDAELWDFAILVQTMVKKLERWTKEPPMSKETLAYNFILHTAEFTQPAPNGFSTRLTILPMLTRAAGFEWATGLHINPLQPELLAELLRAV